jgi:thiaminase
MADKSLTELLMSHPGTAEQYTKATQNDFLRRAGQGKVPRDKLSQWLSQDRLYAQAHCRFLGGLISRVQLPKEQGIDSSFEWRLITLLKGALEGILKELQFFEETARKYGLDLAYDVQGGEFQPDSNTKEFIECFDGFGAEASSGPHALLQGLVVLWTTEKVYLDAWTFALEQEAKGVGADHDLDGGALRKEFIPNWTSKAFNGFVKEIQECLDLFAKQKYSPKEANALALKTWGQVLPLEVGFWPEM